MLELGEDRASQIRSQQQRQRGWKLYCFQAPETQCIAKGKASAPYEFGVKVYYCTRHKKSRTLWQLQSTSELCRSTQSLATPIHDRYHSI